MKAGLLLPTLLTLLVTAAHAQSSVTLYGVLDSGVSYTKSNGAAGSQGGAVRYGSGLMQNDVVGVTGTEDLGGGWRAVYYVESDVSVGAGSAAGAAGLRGRTAGGVAYVGVGR